MPGVTPQLIIRIGSHGEKDYVTKTAPYLDGVIIGANLLEATPGATASLIEKLTRKSNNLGYYLDPMTYAFGTYTDPDTGNKLDNLDWIKSNQKKKNKGIVRDFKKSYRRLAEQFGGLYLEALDRGKAITASDLKSSKVKGSVCASVCDYQINRVKSVFEEDPVYIDYAKMIPPPKVIFAPYFYLEQSNPTFSLMHTLEMGSIAAGLGYGSPVHVVICANKSYLLNKGFLNQLIKEIPETGVAGVWFWFSKLDEYSAKTNELAALRDVVLELSSKMEVYNMRGSYFSLALCKYGMKGISHNVGYGEQRDVVPIIGQALPTVLYYLPGLHRRLKVPDIELCFDDLAVKSAQDFYKKVCDCAICRGVVANSRDEFKRFGDQHYSTPQSKRMAQTPAAAKRCRFHFLLRRIKERDWIKTVPIDDVVDDLENRADPWCQSIAQRSESNKANEYSHIGKWKAVLKESYKTAN